jgi:hypothetical protein
MIDMLIVAAFVWICVLAPSLAVLLGKLIKLADTLDEKARKEMPRG